MCRKLNQKRVETHRIVKQAQSTKLKQTLYAVIMLSHVSNLQTQKSTKYRERRCVCRSDIRANVISCMFIETKAGHAEIEACGNRGGIPRNHGGGVPCGRRRSVGLKYRALGVGGRRNAIIFLPRRNETAYKHKGIMALCAISLLRNARGHIVITLPMPTKMSMAHPMWRIPIKW